MTRSTSDAPSRPAVWRSWASAAWASRNWPSSSPTGPPCGTHQPGGGLWKEAEKLEVQVMETRKAKLGVDHPDTVTSMANLAFTWKSQGRHENALALMQDCVEAQRQVLELEHPDTLSSLGTMSEWSS